MSASQSPDNALPLRGPRYRLLDTATPLRRLHNLERRLSRSGLYMKRDDHMEIALGGNKLRSLEFWLGAAQQAGADTLLVAGGAMSNLCRLTAAAAAMAGFECIVLHNAADSERNRQRSFLNRVFGADVRFLGEVSEQERAAAVTRAAADLRSRGRVPYIVGDEIVGALGYVAAAYELHRQSLQSGASIEHLVVAGSMGTTEAGLVFGNALLGSPFDIHLVSVEYDEVELAARVNRIYDGLGAHTDLDVPFFRDLPVHYHMDYLGDGYGLASAGAEEALLALARAEGILTEHLYTAKTLAGFLDLVTKDRIPPDEPACMLHTGGTPSLFSQFDMFKSIGWE